MFKKNLLLIIVCAAVSVMAQHPAKNWYHLYSVKDTTLGIDLVEALKKFPQPASAKPLIVAVIDGGTDPLHEDLKDNIWVNTKEIPGNSVDDDLNGYVDDINGWDFIGGSESDVHFDNLEMTRLLRDYKNKFGEKTSKEIAKTDRKNYKKFKAIEKIHAKELESANKILKQIESFKNLTDALISETKNDKISIDALRRFEPKKNESKVARKAIIDTYDKTGTTPENFLKEIKEGYDYYYEKVNYHLNLDFNPRSLVGDNYLNGNDKKYGNAEVKGPEALHGTHVAGIIAATRDNNIGMNGIAGLAQIMVLRVVPNGDERDKDVANAIRYAVDNGAKVINMSFGKAYSFDKSLVDEAVKYAESKDVLLIHAAGNDGKNTDKESNFPSPRYLDGTNCRTWIEVGASSMDQNPANFSNYGKKTVNVFAPGVEIYSTIQDNKYEWEQGTSMAGPVVAGLAALIRSYYPALTAIQVKNIIESSVVQPAKKVEKPGTKRKKAKYKKLCTSRGVINATKALSAAAAIK
jgi:subtilisin family serine protease